MVSHDEGRKSWVLNMFSQDVVELWSYSFFILAPHGHGAAKIYLPEEVCEFW